MRWVQPPEVGYRQHLDSWCAGVGPLVFESANEIPRETTRAADGLVIVSWNVHVGAADIDRLVADLRSGRFTGKRRPQQLVLLLQEAVRRTGVPPSLPVGASAAGAIGSEHTIERGDIGRLADSLGMSVFYAPSMRNGSSHPAADRGNAILSTSPLLDPVAIELPGERQRRVAVAARIPVYVGAERVPLAVSTAHLDTLGGPRTLWLFGAAAARANQARSLIDALPSGPMILGADVNSWMGAREPAVRALVSSFPSTPVGRRQPTFAGGLVLDYLFFRLPQGLHAEFQRVHDRYGSDHYPLVAAVGS